MAAVGENRWPYLGRNRWPLTWNQPYGLIRAGTAARRPAASRGHAHYDANRSGAPQSAQCSATVLGRRMVEDSAISLGRNSRPRELLIESPGRVRDT